MGALLACCEADATQFGLDALKKQLEGQTKMVQPDPRIDPEVYVTFLEIGTKDGGSIRFSPQKFTLKDLYFKTSCEVVGNRTQLAAAAAAKGVGAAGEKAGLSQEKTSKMVSGVIGAASKVLGAKDAAKDKMGLETCDRRTVKVDVTVDLMKEFGVEDVAVTVKDVNTDHLAGTVLKVEFVRKFMEKAISAKATEIATRMAKNKTDQTLAKVGIS
jgi:hypothetical protein